jgi:hypothetical protein
VTGNDADRFNFKVPTIRNVEYTYPYFHDGQAKTLEESVDIMGQLQLGRHYTEEEIAKIVAFLKTLTGDMPDIKLPMLPPSSNETPRPDPFIAECEPVHLSADQYRVHATYARSVLRGSSFPREAYGQGIQRSTRSGCTTIPIPNRTTICFDVRTG